MNHFSKPPNLPPVPEKEYCIHMITALEFMKDLKVFFGGCGDCGSAWFVCQQCNKQIEDIYDSLELELK